MIAIVTYIQHLETQGGNDGKCFGFRSTSYSGYIKNDVFIQEMIVLRHRHLFGAENRSSAQKTVKT